MVPSRQIQYGPPWRSPSLLDQRAVYLALRANLEFTRLDRPRNWVKGIVERNSGRYNVSALLRLLGEDYVVDTAWRLLGQGIFASEKKAKKRFLSLLPTHQGNQGQGSQVGGDAGRPHLGHDIVSSDRQRQNPNMNPPGCLPAPPGSQAQGPQVSEGVPRNTDGKGMFGYDEKCRNIVANSSGGLFAPRSQPERPQGSEAAARPHQGKSISSAEPSNTFMKQQAGGVAQKTQTLGTGGQLQQDQKQSQETMFTIKDPRNETATMFGFGNAAQAPGVPQETPRPAPTSRSVASVGGRRFACTLGTSATLAKPRPASATSIPASASLEPTASAASLSASAPRTSAPRVPAQPKETTPTSIEQAKHDSSKVPSLFPTYLPRKSQHLLLVHLQKVLEQACFDFGKQKFPEVLAENKWDCAESVELNRWAELLTSRPEFSGPESQQSSFRPPSELFSSVAGIRHAAVGRHNITAVDLQERLVNAVDLLSLLKDTPRATELRKLQRGLHKTVDNLRKHKHKLTKSMEATVRDAASQRLEADRMETQAAKSMKDRDGAYQEQAGLDLELAVLSAQHATAGGPDTSMFGMAGG